MNQFVTLPIESPIQIHQPVFRDDGSLPPPEPVVSARMPKINLPLGDNPTLSYKDLNNNFYDNVPKLVEYTRNGMFGKWLLARDDLKDLYDSFQDYLDINQSDIDVFAQLCEVMGIEFNQSKAKAQCENNKSSHKVTDKVFSKVSEVIQNENVQSAMTQAKTLAGGLFSKAEEVIKEKVQPKIDTESLKSGFFSSFFKGGNNQIGGSSKPNFSENNQKISEETQLNHSPEQEKRMAEQVQKNLENMTKQFDSSNNSTQGNLNPFDIFSMFGDLGNVLNQANLNSQQQASENINAKHEENKKSSNESKNNSEVKPEENKTSFEQTVSHTQEKRDDDVNKKQSSTTDNQIFSKPFSQQDDNNSFATDDDDDPFASFGNGIDDPLISCKLVYETSHTNTTKFNVKKFNGSFTFERIFDQPYFTMDQRFVLFPLFSTYHQLSGYGYSNRWFDDQYRYDDNGNYRDNIFFGRLYDLKTHKLLEEKDLPDSAKKWMDKSLELIKQERFTNPTTYLSFLKTRNYWRSYKVYNHNNKVNFLYITSKDKDVNILMLTSEKTSWTNPLCIIKNNSELILETIEKVDKDGGNVFSVVNKLSVGDYFQTEACFAYYDFQTIALSEKYMVYAEFIPEVGIDYEKIQTTCGIDFNSFLFFRLKQPNFYSSKDEEKEEKRLLTFKIKLLSLNKFELIDVCEIKSISIPYCAISNDSKQLIIYYEQIHTQGEKRDNYDSNLTLSQVDVVSFIKHYELDS